MKNVTSTIGLLASGALLAVAGFAPAAFAQQSVSLTVADFAQGGPDEVFSKLEPLAEIAQRGEGKIAVLLPDTRSSSRWMDADAPGFERAFAAMGLTKDDYIISNAQGLPQTQRTQAEQAITNGATVILMTNLDSGSGAAIQADAVAKGVTVIDYDRLTLNGSAGYYVTFDNQNVGERMAEGLVSCMADWNVQDPHIYHLGGSPTDNNATLVEAGYDSVLNKLYESGEATKVGAVRVPNWDSREALTMFEQAWRANPDINAVLTANDAFAQVAVSVFKNAGVPAKTIPTTGQDATLAGLQNILSDWQCMTVYKPIYREAAAAAALAVVLNAGEDVGPNFVNGEYDADSHKVPTMLLDLVSVTKENMAETVVADGFVDPKELCTEDFADACKDNGITF